MSEHDFEPHRRYLVSVAYRMLGSIAEAEDAVQDAYLRWQNVDHASVSDARAYLGKVVTRLSLDRLKSARMQREKYVGTWLPEPIVEDAGAAAAEDVSVALMMTLERLSPLERAAFLLHDVFDLGYADIASALDRSEAACRQLAARGRTHVRENRPRFDSDRGTEQRVTEAFAVAVSTGDVTGLAAVLAEDAVLYSDGGGKRSAALNPIYGRDKILRFFLATARKGRLPTDAQVVRINGHPGFLFHRDDGVETLALEIRHGKIVAFYGVRNPEKLRHLA
ncbi:MAG: sigma-70 family RNA polymerase sigma factor [Myxococcales bacterium]|nr:sigma-70 family RNA polymerase sigma factor [Myxococcales bacterium]MCB9575470.1 sigma-70 family RNA polymerase sigma factor [Polyangiaceae bacterium]